MKGVNGKGESGENKWELENGRRERGIGENYKIGKERFSPPNNQRRRKVNLYLFYFLAKNIIHYIGLNPAPNLGFADPYNHV